MGIMVAKHVGIIHGIITSTTLKLDTCNIRGC